VKGKISRAKEMCEERLMLGRLQGQEHVGLAMCCVWFWLACLSLVFFFYLFLCI
jgi:hypothetical protein